MAIGMQMREQTTFTKTMQAETAIPPISFQDYPIDVNLDICKQGEQYWLQIIGWGQRKRYSMNMTAGDLANLNKYLHQEIYGIARNNEQEPLTKQELEDLAGIGHYAFRRVFHDSGAEDAIKQLVCRNKKVAIEIASEDFFLPWELIYPASLDEPISCYDFWGMKHLVSRLITQDNRPGAFVSPIIGINICPKLGVLTYKKLRGVFEKEMPFFKKLHDEGKLTLNMLHSLDLHNKREGLKEFKSFWKKNFNLAHFACHAFYELDSPDQSYILLSEDFPITIKDMDTYDMEINGHPLIIMNACETGNLNPLYSSNFAATFLKYGARGVVATECAVPDAFAADFSEHLYTHFLKGKRLGESLLTTRQYFLEKYSNPAGLLYSMYAPPSIRLVQTGDLNE